MASVALEEELVTEQIYHPSLKVALAKKLVITQLYRPSSKVAVAIMLVQRQIYCPSSKVATVSADMQPDMLAIMPDTMVMPGSMEDMLEISQGRALNMVAALALVTVVGSRTSSIPVLKRI